jgi:hypothetical protein
MHWAYDITHLELLGRVVILSAAVQIQIQIQIIFIEPDTVQMHHCSNIKTYNTRAKDIQT